MMAKSTADDHYEDKFEFPLWKIIKQRDYYDLWGDILDNIPRIGKMYRKFMKKKFG